MNEVFSIMTMVTSTVELGQEGRKNAAKLFASSKWEGHY
jgi:hypothetical protein